MSRKRWASISIPLLLLVLFRTGFAQPLGVAPLTDPRPLERPTPFAFVDTGDSARILPGIAAVLIDFGYSIQVIEKALIDAKRLDSLDPQDDDQDYDRVIVWLERDFDRPLERLNVYLLYGRYEMIWGETTRIFRIMLSEEDEAARVGALRSAIIEYLLFGQDTP